MDQEQAITLIEYNIWASHKGILKAARLRPAGLLAETTLDHHTALGTLVHILDTQWYWRERAQSGKLPTKALAPADFPNLSSLRRRWDAED